jgi:hypothetical protein
VCQSPLGCFEEAGLWPGLHPLLPAVVCCMATTVVVSGGGGRAVAAAAAAAGGYYWGRLASGAARGRTVLKPRAQDEHRMGPTMEGQRAQPSDWLWWGGMGTP